MGNAEFLCDDLVKAVPAGVNASSASMEDVPATNLRADTFYVFVVSTYGAGDIPNTAQPFFDDLQAAKPDLSHVRFAMFGLGDRNFGETFNLGSQRVMDLLTDCGATLVGERGIFDASGPKMPEDVAEPWLLDILSKVAATA